MNRAYLLLDSHLIPNIFARLFKLAHITVAHSLYLTTRYAEMASFGPVLVSVEPGSALANTFIEQWQGRAGIWLESDADETLVLEHLRSLIHVRLEGDVTAFFRFYDPCITRLWLAGLAEAERDQLMGPVRVIRLPEGVVIQQNNPHQPCARYASTPWLTLSAQTLEHLCQARREHFTQRLVEHGQRYFAPCLQGLDEPAQQAWALGCQRNAARQGYSADDEVMAWASLYATFGDEFPEGLEHAVYRQVLSQRAVAPEQRLEQLLDELMTQMKPAERAL